jgi:hypothetical protein
MSSLLLVRLEVLVDDCDSQENSSARTNGTEQIRNDGQSPDAHAAKRSCSGDVTVEYLHPHTSSPRPSGRNASMAVTHLFVEAVVSITLLLGSHASQSELQKQGRLLQLL